MPPQSTSYGALDLSSEKKTRVGSSTMRIVVGVAFVCIAAVACYLTISTTSGTAVPTTVHKTYTQEELSDALKSAPALNEPGIVGKDCVCATPCTLDPKSKVAGVGSCPVVAELKGNCVGFDFKYAKFDKATAKYTAACELAKGRYDCFSFPCQNGGYCVDGVDKYKCQCAFGFDGANCENDINECLFDWKKNKSGEKFLQVCDPNADCSNLVVDPKTKKRGYSCKCKSGFKGDGYQKNQAKVKYGTILTASGLPHAWLDRSAPKYDLSGCEDIDDCTPNPCSPQFPAGKTKAKCTDLGPNSYKCTCGSLMPKEQWTGKKEGEDGNCDVDVRECGKGGKNNCDGERAICHETQGSFECSCRQHWFGDGYDPQSKPKTWGKTKKFTGCKDVDDCKVPIRKDGKTVGFKSPCVRGTCTNNGLGTGKFNCACPPGWRGHICDTDINECDEYQGEKRALLGCDFPKATCVNTPGSWRCFCHKGWTGNGYLSVKKIKKGRINAAGKTLDPGCVDADDCEFIPCKNGATCDDEGTEMFVCTCVRGWKGLTCEEDWNECTMGIHTCHEAARCHNTPGSFTCSCEKGFSGDGYRMCNRMDNCVHWEDGPAVDSKLTDYAQKFYKVQTAAEIKAKAPLVLDEAKTKAFTFDRGLKSNLIKHAPWKDDIILMALDAVELAKGNKKMVQVTKCGTFKASGSPRTFAKHGECQDIIDPNIFGMFLCNCHAGWADKNCDRDINECLEGSNECHSYATCTNSEGSYSCACNFGYTGDGVASCHDIDDCTTGVACANGFCTDLGANDFRCTCVEGYTDKLCDEDIDECGKMAHECNKHYATCTNTKGSYTCKCNKGFQGTGIGKDSCKDINDCASAPCEHGKCSDVGAGMYECGTRDKDGRLQCDKGWTDFNCDYDADECLMKTHNCHETGRCVNTPGSFFCRCVSGYQGDGYTCTDLDDCDPDPCDPEHGTCEDRGQNRYYCKCELGWTGIECSENIDECMENTHACHNNAFCIDLMPKGPKGARTAPYDCRCDDGFFGNTGSGNHCEKCTVCSTECKDGEGYGCGTGPGMKNDPKKANCVATDRKCVDVDECVGANNCDVHATCANTYGSFTCECINERCEVKAGGWGEYPPQCTETARCYYGDGTKNQCASCTQCGGGQAKNKFGDYMFRDASSTRNRVCKTILEDGYYAVESEASGVAQCLVRWKEPQKIYPERYAWGGIADDRSQVRDKKGKIDGMKTADLCDHPICGVCDWDGRTAAENIMAGQEAAWYFKRLKDDLYLIMNRADGRGLRCLGFGSKDSPYPELLTWAEKPEEGAEGACYDKAGVIIRPEKKCTKKKAGKECAAGTTCKYGEVMVGAWNSVGKGATNVDDYYCGFTAHGGATAASRVTANGAAVWSVHALGCRGKWCEKRTVKNRFVLRSAVRKDTDKDNVVDANDYECLHFGRQFVGQASHPTRVPRIGSKASADSVFGWKDEDVSGDPDCGIRLPQDGKNCACVGKLGNALKDLKTQQACVKTGNKWACPNNMPYAQEKALLENKQAVFKLHSLA